jgi:hypothetical protein
MREDEEDDEAFAGSYWLQQEINDDVYRPR